MCPYSDAAYGPRSWNTLPRARHAGPMYTITPHQPAAVRVFAQRLSATRRGARLARLLVAERLTAWEVSPSVAERAAQITAELAANAVFHGRVQGRDFRVALTCVPASGGLRIEVTDPHGERLPLHRRTPKSCRPTPSRAAGSSWSPPSPTAGAWSRTRRAARRCGRRSTTSGEIPARRSARLRLEPPDSVLQSPRFVPEEGGGLLVSGS
ncbi:MULTISPECIES: ATP-binding protein [Streptomyces]|uniref:ATP-binding protein n=1 Tax=Streptomyces TaxID=1883 RepID=UPI003570F668